MIKQENHITASLLADRLKVKDKSICYVASTNAEALMISKELSLYLHNNQIQYFPEKEILPYDHFSSPESIIKNRFSILNEKWKDNVLVTLHGYLRILPPSFCDKTRIYNGHPGLITKHPELKGFNPQKKAFEAGTYKTVGSVIHEVIPELDSGDVVAEGEINNDFDNLENCTLALHDLSIQLC